jgi:gamma-D-glutamyl-L-lysine dipeptidyl-peptidase
MLSSFFLASMSLLHFVVSPVATMREFPAESAEIVSQAYFSEEVNIIEELQDWIRIETVRDHYQGWIKAGEICHRTDQYPSLSSKVARVNRCRVHLYHLPDTIYGPLLTLPFESLLEVKEDDGASRWIHVLLPDQREGYIQRGDVTFNLDCIPHDQLPSVSLLFEGLPYTWGGRSSFGYDCSGFVQMLYRQMGVSLPRDSKDQVKWGGFTNISIEDLSQGDLIFFGSDEIHIRHVGMYLGSDRFIHATVAENAPYIHTSRLSDPEWSGGSKWTYRTARSLKKDRKDPKF